MRMNKALVVMMAAVAAMGLSSTASAGFLDTFNRASQAVQQTTGTIENVKYTAQRAGNAIPKTKKSSAKSAEKVSAQETGGDLSPKTKAAIEKAKRAWVAAFKAEDWDALVDQYAEDAVILPPDEEAVSGREAIRANFTTDEDTSNEVFETIDMNGDDNIVYVQGAFSFNIAAKGSEPIAASGKYIEIWQKQSDGNWLITHDIWNANPVVSE